MVKAVLFDLDDTLILEEKATEEAFLAAASLAYRRYGLSPEKLLKTIQGLAEDFWKTAPAYRWCQQVGISPREALWADFADEIPEARIMQSWIPDFRRRCWQEALRKSGIEDLSLAEEMATCYRKECRQRHRLFPEVRPVLKRLSSWPLAMVTNGLRRHQCEKINQAGLARFFSVVVVSSDLGRGKPAPEIFRLALSALSVSPREACMVGNSWLNDISGALKTGMKAVWVNRDGEKLPSGVKPQAIISSLKELPELLPVL